MIRDPNTAKVQDLHHLIHLIATLHKERELVKKPAIGVFNIFDEGNLSWRENTHSNIIAALLDGTRAHRHPEFGQQFIKMLNGKLPTKIFSETESLSVRTEKWIDARGRVDIHIESNSFILVIENKLGAQDRDGQLRNYYGWLKREKKRTAKTIGLLYLTLEGKNPSDCSFDDNTHKEFKINQDTFMTLSYSSDILPWLKSLRVRDNETQLKTSIDQYIETLQNICGHNEEDRVELVACNT